jgi:carbonic anhydrase
MESGLNSIDPESVLKKFREGNKRYVAGITEIVELSPQQRRELAVRQNPIAVVVGCSDSRVPVEMLFDQSVGSIFVARVAGNVIDTSVSGSIDFALTHLDVKLIIILGHEDCGAVSAALSGEDTIAAQGPNLQKILRQIRPAVCVIPPMDDKTAHSRAAIIANVEYQISGVRKELTVREAENEGLVRVVGAYCHITTGEVEFLVPQNDLSEQAATKNST